VQVHREKQAIVDAGANVYVIGNGSPSFIAGFRETTGYDGPIYTDPSLEVYKAAQLKRGITKTLDPRALGKTLGAFMRGHKQGLTQGDNWQQGGALVVGTDGRVLWHHASERPGDNASPAQIVAALQSVRA
jgi:AhpC/TSA antioxidant enzyme